MVEAGTDAVYVASVPTLVAGTYTVTYHDTLGLVGSAELFWDGVAEINFGNFEVDINVATASTDAAIGLPTVLADIDGTNKSNDNVIRFLHDEMQEPILFLLANYLLSQNKLISDVTEVFFVIKENQTDSDVAALYSKLLSDAEITIDLTQSSVSALITDYTGLEVNGRYYMTMGIKYAGDTQWREIPANRKLIEFRQDVIRA
jgi:hypothetical protein